MPAAFATLGRVHLLYCCDVSDALSRGGVKSAARPVRLRLKFKRQFVFGTLKNIAQAMEDAVRILACCIKYHEHSVGILA
jgi:hypothetical protein